jgi:glutathione S-transferase
MLTLYDAARCPYCARVRVVLAEKHVECDVVELDVAARRLDLREERHRARACSKSGWTSESAVTMEFLEERLRAPLLAADAASALARLGSSADDFTKPYPHASPRRGGAAERFAAELARLDNALTERPWWEVPVRARRYRLRSLGVARARPARRLARRRPAVAA